MLPIHEVIKIAEQQLKDAGISDAKRDAKELFCFTFKMSSTDLMMRWHDNLQDQRVECYFKIIESRASRIPFQYIVGDQEFMGLTFKVNKDVLIPRQDTETLVEDAVDLITKGTIRSQKLCNPMPDAKVLDLCTGSGAIGISIAKLCPKTKVTMSDISKNALKVASENADSNGVKVNIVESDMFKKFSKGLGNKKFNLIASNPPYIKTDVIETLEPEVKDYEPRTALDGGETGLDFYRIIADEAWKHLEKYGFLIMEIGYDQAADVATLLEESNHYIDIRVFKDLADLDRIVFCRLKG